MANNRLWAVCKDDNEAKCLTKYSPTGGDWGGFHEQPEFFAKHDKCPSNHGCGENMKFVTETEDDRVKEYDFRDFKKIKIIFK